MFDFSFEESVQLKLNPFQCTMLFCFRWSSDCGRCILYRLTRPPLCGVSPSTPVCSAASEDTGTTAWCYSPHGSPSLALHLQLCKLARNRRPPCVTHDCRPLTSTILIGLYESATSILARSLITLQQCAKTFLFFIA